MSILLDGSKSRSQSLDCDDDHQRDSVDRLFDDDEDVVFATPSKSSRALEKSPEYVPAQEGPESEEELTDRVEVTQDSVRSSPFTCKHSSCLRVARTACILIGRRIKLLVYLQDAVALPL